MVLEMVYICLDEAGQSHRAGDIVRSGSSKHRIWKESEYPSKLSAPNVKQCDCVINRLVVAMESFDIRRLISIKQCRVIFSNDAFHSINCDRIAIGEMDDEFLNRPFSGGYGLR